VVDTRFAAQSAQFNKDLQALSERFASKQNAQTEQLRREWEQRINQLISWMIVTTIAFFGTVIALAAIIINRLPS